MTAQHTLDDAEVDFLAHCRANYEAPALVFRQDSALIEMIARKTLAFAQSIAADLAQLQARDTPNPTPVSDLAEVVAEALDRDMSQDAAGLLYAQVRYLVAAPATTAQARAA